MKYFDSKYSLKKIIHFVKTNETILSEKVLELQSNLRLKFLLLIFAQTEIFYELFLFKLHFRHPWRRATR